MSCSKEPKGKTCVALIWYGAPHPEAQHASLSAPRLRCARATGGRTTCIERQRREALLQLYYSSLQLIIAAVAVTPYPASQIRNSHPHDQRLAAQSIARCSSRRPNELLLRHRRHARQPPLHRRPRLETLNVIWPRLLLLLLIFLVDQQLCRSSRLGRRPRRAGAARQLERRGRHLRLRRVARPRRTRWRAELSGVWLLGDRAADVVLRGWRGDGHRLRAVQRPACPADDRTLFAGCRRGSAVCPSVGGWGRRRGERRSGADVYEERGSHQRVDDERIPSAWK